MRSRYRISVGGIQLDTLDDDLLILDIQHSEPEFVISENRIANEDGYDFSADSEYFKKTTVTVTFELHIYDVAQRNAVCQKVNAWARNGGTLTVNDRAGQRLWNTRCEKFASISSAKNWTDPLTLVFATTYIPYWLSDNEKTLTLTGKSAKGKLKMDGNIGAAQVKATVTAGGNITSFQITAGDKTLKLTGLSLANGKDLVIDYVHNRYLRIMADGKSVLDKLDKSSADLLTVPCGADTQISISANNKVTAVITARGRWL